MGLWKTDFQLKMSQWSQSSTALLPLSPPLTRSLVMPGLARTPKGKNSVHCPALELKGFVKKETACRTRSTFHLSRLDYFISIKWRVASKYWALLQRVIHQYICSVKRSSIRWSLWYLLVTWHGVYYLPDSYVKSIFQAKNKWLWHTKPILFQKFFAFTMCIRQINGCNPQSVIHVSFVRSWCDPVQWTFGTRLIV